MAVFDREGVFILKIDRMLYGFYYFTSCPVGLLCLNWRGSAAARVKNRTLRKDSVAAAAMKAFPPGAPGNDSAASQEQRARWKCFHWLEWQQSAAATATQPQRGAHATLMSPVEMSS